MRAFFVSPLSNLSHRFKQKKTRISTDFFHPNRRRFKMNSSEKNLVLYFKLAFDSMKTMEFESLTFKFHGFRLFFMQIES